MIFRRLSQIQPFPSQQKLNMTVIFMLTNGKVYKKKSMNSVRYLSVIYYVCFIKIQYILLGASPIPFEKDDDLQIDFIVAATVDFMFKIDTINRVFSLIWI